MTLTPLDEIPDRYAGDPQAGLVEIGRYLGAGTIAQTEALHNYLWRTHIIVTDVTRGRSGFAVDYHQPDERGNWKQGEYDQAKVTAIKRWLHDLTNVVREYRGEPTVDWNKRTGSSVIKQALAQAVAKPDAPIQRPVSRKEDDFVARVMARKHAVQPS